MAEPSRKDMNKLMHTGWGDKNKKLKIYVRRSASGTLIWSDKKGQRLPDPYNQQTLNKQTFIYAISLKMIELEKQGLPPSEYQREKTKIVARAYSAFNPLWKATASSTRKSATAKNGKKTKSKKKTISSAPDESLNWMPFVSYEWAKGLSAEDLTLIYMQQNVNIYDKDILDHIQKAIATDLGLEVTKEILEECWLFGLHVRELYGVRLHCYNTKFWPFAKHGTSTTASTNKEPLPVDNTNPSNVEMIEYAHLYKGISEPHLIPDSIFTYLRS